MSCALVVLEYMVRDQPFANESRHAVFVVVLLLSLPLSLATVAACFIVEAFYPDNAI